MFNMYFCMLFCSICEKVTNAGRFLLHDLFISLLNNKSNDCRKLTDQSFAEVARLFQCSRLQTAAVKFIRKLRVISWYYDRWRSLCSSAPHDLTTIVRASLPLSYFVTFVHDKRQCSESSLQASKVVQGTVMAVLWLVSNAARCLMFRNSPSEITCFKASVAHGRHQ